MMNALHSRTILYLFSALLALSVSSASVPARAQMGGIGAALNAATVAAVAGYGAQTAATAADDDDD